MFLGTEPLQASFLPTVFLQGLVTTLFFGWLAVYPPSFFPVELRASGSGLAYNVSRFATALGVFFAGSLLATFGNSYPRIGAACGVLYGVGIFASFAIGTGVLTSLARASQDSKS